MRAFFALLTAFILLPSLAYADSEYDYRTVSVSGEAEIEAVPDQAELPIEIRNEHKNLTHAKTENDKKVAALLQVIEKYEIPKAKIKNTAIQIHPQYRWEKNKQIFEHYVVSRQMRITIDKLENVEKLIAEITDIGIDRVHGVEFTLSNPEAIERQARVQAIQNAKTKAAELATAAGVKLGKAMKITLNESNSGPRPPIPMMAKAQMAMNESAADMAPPTMPGLTVVRQSVYAVFELE